ncbi:hypothetical protein D3C86_1891660 [compost metagenome]
MVLAGKGVGQVDEDAAHSALFHEGAEQNEQEYIGRRHAQRHAVDAFGGEEHLGDDALKVPAGMAERLG